jgi:hypothetical protein
VSAVSELRPGVRSSFCVQRRVKLTPLSLILLEQQPSVISALGQQAELLIGFNQLELRDYTLWLEYDAGHQQLDTWLALLEQAGVHPDMGRWSRMRLGWYRYQDANIRDNSRNTSSTACSQSPLRHR